MSDTSSISISERIFTEPELAQLRSYYSSVVGGHDVCEGTKILVVKGEVEQCVCAPVYYYLKELVYARLPKKHILYDQKFAPQKDEGLSLSRSSVISGKFLSGKTTVLTMLGKEAIAAGLSVVYFSINELIKFKLTKDKDKSAESEAEIILERIAAADVLLIDNYTAATDSDWGTTFTENFIREANDRDAKIYIAVEEGNSFTEAMSNRVARVTNLLGRYSEVKPSVKAFSDSDAVNISVIDRLKKEAQSFKEGRVSGKEKA